MMQRKVFCFASLLLAALATLSAVTAQKNDKAEALLQAAQHKQLVEGDLKGAIQLYQQIIAQHGSNRAAVAKALVLMGKCYEKQGLAQARKAYDRVVREYGDQREMVAEARTRLSALSPTASKVAANKAATGPTVRQVWVGSDVGLGGTPSPDGRYLSFVLHHHPSGDVAVRDLVTGETRRVTNSGPDPKEEADEIIWSPDGKQLAYSCETWSDPAIDSELHVIGLDGSKPRVLYRNKETEHVDPRGWSPDGKHILADFWQRDHTRQIVWVAVADGSVQIIKKLTLEAMLGRISLSPDGRYLVYDVDVQKDSAKRDIFLLSADGSREMPLIQHPADDQILGWAPDGKTILFASDRGGTWDAWSITVVEGKVQGAAERVKREIGKVHPLGFSRNGSFYYTLGKTTTSDIYTAELAAETGKLNGAPVLAKTRYIGFNGGLDWSPDGRSLVYRSFSRIKGGTADVDKLVVLNPETGEEREFHTKLLRFSPPRWFPDGKSILVRDQAGGAGLFKIDPATGDAALFVPEKPGAELFVPLPSHDGKMLFFQNKNSIWKRKLETGEDQEVYRATTPNKNPTFIGNIVLSPDGQRLAFKLGQSLIVIPTTGGAARELLKLREPEPFTSYGTVAWTPDGRYLLFVQSGDKQPELWRVSADGSEPQKLGPLLEGVLDLHIHPDGRRIAFTVQQPAKNKAEVWVMENFLPTAQSRKTSISRH